MKFYLLYGKSILLLNVPQDEEIKNCINLFWLIWTEIHVIVETAVVGYMKSIPIPFTELKKAGETKWNEKKRDITGKQADAKINFF